MEGELTAHAAVLVLARESRGMTQSEVAATMSGVAGETVSQAYVSKAESGRLTVSGERLSVYAAAVRYPVEVLCSDLDVHGVGIGLVYHRKKASMGAKALRRVHAELMFTRMQVRALLRTERHWKHLFRRVELGRLDTPADLARSVRAEWGLSKVPIPGVVAAVEAAGGLVVARDLDADGLDAVTQWTGEEPPLFLVDVEAPIDRFRFSLAHEIGHAFLHGGVGGGLNVERQADEFASEFLLPAEEVRDSFTGPVNLGLLLGLKLRWGASMAALARRALTLDAVSEWQYRQLMVEMSALGYRTQEPGHLPAETPHTVARLAIRLLADAKSLDTAARLVGLLPDEFRDLYLSKSNNADLSPTS